MLKFVFSDVEWIRPIDCNYGNERLDIRVIIENGRNKSPVTETLSTRLKVYKREAY